MALTIESILPTEQAKNIGETIEIATVASGGVESGCPIGETFDDWELNPSLGDGKYFLLDPDTYFSANNKVSVDFIVKDYYPNRLDTWNFINIFRTDIAVTMYGWNSKIAYGVKIGTSIVSTPHRTEYWFKNDYYIRVRLEGTIDPNVWKKFTGTLYLDIINVDTELVFESIEVSSSQVLNLNYISVSSSLTYAKAPTIFNGHIEGLGLPNDCQGLVPNYTYQYKKDGAIIDGVTSNPYSKTAEESDSGSYTCTVSDGVDTVTSDAVGVVVNVPQTKNGTVEIDGTPVKFRSYTPSPLVSYKLKPMSNGSMRNVDRGIETDSFTASVTFRGTVDERDELLAILKNARDTRTPLTMENFAVPLFGDHVDYTNPITAYVVSQTVPTMADSAKTQSFTIVFKIDGQVDTSGDESIPSLSCARYTTRGGYNHNAILLSSYTQAHSMIDMELDTPTFTGEYDMSPVDTARLLRFWRLQRGEAFQVSDLGTINPFGERFPAPYIVYIISVEVEPMFNNLRRVKLTLSLRS